MPRRPEPEGRRNSVCTRLSDAELAAVEAARGDMGMSEWVRFTLLISADAIRQAEAAQRNYAAEAPRRAHAVTCKCLTCKPEGGKR